MRICYNGMASPSAYRPPHIRIDNLVVKDVKTGVGTEIVSREFNGPPFTVDDLLTALERAEELKTMMATRDRIFDALGS